MNKINIVTLLFCCSLLASCVGDMLGTNRDFSTYEESISSFLLTEDGKKLVVVGNGFHYIFDLDEKLKNILLSKNKLQITPRFINIRVDVNNHLSVDLELHSDDMNVDWLKSSGFYLRDDKRKQYVFSVNLKGTRYKAEQELPAKYKFNNPYSVTVYVDDSGGSQAVKILLTPVAIAADATILVVGLAVVLTYVVLSGKKFRK